MSILATYIKTITFYVVFINIIEMIMPNKDEKYSSYIRLFLGLVLMYIIIKPLFSLNLNLSNIEVLENYESYILSNSQSIDIENIEETKKSLITKSYIESKEEEVKILIEKETKYKVLNCELVIDTTLDSYGDLNSIYLELIENGGELVEIIKPVEIGKNNMSQNDENDKTLEIKNLIKEVYNLSLNNIHINIANK